MGLSALALWPALRRTTLERLAGWFFVTNAACTAIGAAAYLWSGDPSQWLAVASLIVWGIVFPLAALAIAVAWWPRMRAT